MRTSPVLVVVVGFFGITASTGCARLQDALYGQPCSADDACADGYGCHPDRGYCVPKDQMPSQTLLSEGEGEGAEGEGEAGEGEGEGEADECTRDDDCSDGAFCNGAEICNVAHQCVDGADPCSGDTAQCDEANDLCVACLGDEDCAQDTLFCNGDEVCVDGACVHTGNDCADFGDVCTESLDSCTECNTTADCNAVLTPAQIPPPDNCIVCSNHQCVNDPLCPQQ